MKVGVISKGSPDYLIDIVCDGLIRKLGRENVAMDYNHKSRWGGQYSILMGGVEQPNSFDIHDAEVLVASDRSVQAMEEWMKRTGKKAVAFIDGEDDTHLRYDHDRVAVYFKREYIAGRAYPSKVRPLPFAAIPEAVPDKVLVERPVFYLGHDSNPVRRELRAALKEAGFEPSITRVEKDAYNRMLVSSLVGISVRGCGWDTYRYWEIPYFGSALLSQRLEIVIPENFEEGREASFFGSMPEMLSKLRGMLSDPDMTLAMAAEGRRACLARHLSVNRARTVLEALA